MKKDYDISDWIAPGRAVLLVIDMQADFADASGAKVALANAARLVDAARAAGVDCIFTYVETRQETDSPAWRERLARRGGAVERAMNLCRADSPGARFVGPQPATGELVIAKRGYSAFFATGLEAALAARARDTLVVCGLTTECCVEASARDAFERDFHVFVARDACAGEAGLHEAALAMLDRHAAILLDSAEILLAWS